MKKIQSKKHRQLEADQELGPSIDREQKNSPARKNKKRKKIYQTGVWVDDVDINDVGAVDCTVKAYARRYSSGVKT